MFHTAKEHAGYKYIEAEWAAQRAWCYPREMEESGRVDESLPTGTNGTSEQWAEFVTTLQAALRDVTAAPQRVARAVELLSHSPEDTTLGGTLSGRGTSMSDNGRAGVWPRVTRCGHFEVGINGTDGSIAHLVDTRTGRQWAGPQNPLARLV